MIDGIDYLFIGKTIPRGRVKSIAKQKKDKAGAIAKNIFNIEIPQGTKTQVDNQDGYYTEYIHAYY